MTTYSYCEKGSVCFRDTKKVNITKTVKEIAGLLSLFAVGVVSVALKTLIYVNL